MPRPELRPPLRIVGIVPMRHHSERVRGKNYREFGGRPLFHRIVESLLDVPEMDEVVIDTDSDLIASDALQRFPERLRIVTRPEHLRDGHTAMNDVLLNTVDHVPADLYVQSHSTNPLLSARTVSAAIRTLVAALPYNDSLFSVTQLQTRLWWDAQRAVNHDPAVLLRTQDLPPVYEENSNLYIFSAQTLRQRHNRIGATPVMFQIDRHEAWDIDEELDFVVAEFLASRLEIHA